MTEEIQTKNTVSVEAKAEVPGFIFPTVGRRIHYRPATDDRSMNNLDIDMPPGSGQPMDAGIVYVRGPRLVNLAIHDHEGYLHVKQNVPLVQEGDDMGGAIPGGSRDHYCHWMPFQAGQAKAASDVGSVGSSVAQRVCNP